MSRRQLFATGTSNPQEARQEYISSYALALWSLGAAGKEVVKSGPRWQRILDGGLASINWLKTNPDWQGICMAENEVGTRMPTRRATADYIKWKIGLTENRPPSVISEQRQQTATERTKASTSDNKPHPGPPPRWQSFRIPMLGLCHHTVPGPNRIGTQTGAPPLSAPTPDPWTYTGPKGQGGSHSSSLVWRSILGPGWPR